MNILEKKMLDTLIDLRENHFVTGVKAEFEAEGTRLEEALRLKEVVTRAGLGLTMKIGGCEAVRDMYEARVIGVSRIVGPMIESPYALKKFLSAVNLSFPKDELSEVSFLVNIETIDGYKNIDRILAIDEIERLDGIVLGRVDMVGSMSLSRDSINSSQIHDITVDLFRKAKQKSLECVLGGGVGAEALPFLRKLPEGLIDRYETRKVIFECPGGLCNGAAEKGILKAVGFELMWLKNKRDFYGLIFEEDKHRIYMLQNRYDKLIKDAGGV